MSRTGRKGAEEARNRLPELVPVDQVVDKSAQKSLMPLKGTGRGLWGKNSSRTIRALRDEWSR